MAVDTATSTPGPPRPLFQHTRHLEITLVVLIMLALLTLNIWLRLHTLQLPFDRDSYDEGVYWQTLRSMATGKALYAQTFYSQPPFFIWSVYPAYLLLGQNIWAARLGIALVSLLGLPGAYLLGRALRGRIVALFALLLITTTPLYIAASQTLQAEGPSVALSFLAVGLAYCWWNKPSGRGGLLLAVGTTVTLAAAIFSKLLSFSTLVPIGILALAHLWRVSHLTDATSRVAAIRSLLVGCATFMLVSLLMLLPFVGSFAQFWQMVVTFHTTASSQFHSTQATNRTTIVQFLNTPLTYLALCTTIVAFVRRDWRVIPLLAWFLATTYLLWQQVPLFPHHLVSLVPPLISLVLVGLPAMQLQYTRAKLSTIYLKSLRQYFFAGLLLILTCVVILFNFINLRHYYNVIGEQGRSQATQQNIQVARDLDKALQPGDLVITDAQFIAGLADRNTPPALVDTSTVRLNTNSLSTQMLLREAASPQVHAVLFYTHRLSTQQAFITWVSQHYRLLHDYGAGNSLWIKIQ